MTTHSKLCEIIKESGLYIMGNTHYSTEQVDCEKEALSTEIMERIEVCPKCDIGNIIDDNDMVNLKCPSCEGRGWIIKYKE